MEEVRQQVVIYIYRLLDPLDGNAVRYVGQSSEPERRLVEHLSRARQGDRTHRGNWLRKLMAAGLQPILEIVEAATLENWIERERYWIAFHRAQGCRLVNLTDGGDGVRGLKHSEESRRKVSESRRGKGQWSEARKQEWAERFRGEKSPFFRRPIPEEQRAKISATLMGRPSPKKGKPAPPGRNYCHKRYLALSPAGEEILITNMRQFCEERGLIPSSMYSAAAGKIKNHQGWRCRHIEGAPFESRETPRHIKKLGDAEFILTSPEGLEHRTRSLIPFCEERGLNWSSLYAVLRGEYATHRGWKIRRPDESLMEMEARMATASPGDRSRISDESRAAWAANLKRQPSPEERERGANKIRRDYIATSPQGEEIIVHGLVAFAREYGLRAPDLCRVLKGERPHHKGWRIRRPDQE